MYTELNTQLGGMIFGEFDISFDERTCRCVITVRVKYEFVDGISAANQASFIARFVRAASVWDRAASLECISSPGCECCCPGRIPIEVNLVSVTDDTAHHVVDVDDEPGRASVIDEINVWFGESRDTLVHEFGHVLGNYDEYPADIFEEAAGNLPFFEWRETVTPRDPASVMDTGYFTAATYVFRERHFQRIADWLNDELPAGRCRLRIRI